MPDVLARLPNQQPAEKHEIDASRLADVGNQAMLGRSSSRDHKDTELLLRADGDVVAPAPKRRRIRGEQKAPMIVETPSVVAA